MPHLFTNTIYYKEQKDYLYHTYINGKIMNESLEALKAYVTGPSSQNEAESTVRLLVTHSNLKSRFMEIRLDKHMSIGAVKEKLQTHCGTSASSMVLCLKDGHGHVLVETLQPDSCKLGYFSPEQGHILHVHDTDPMSLAAQGWLEDVSKVEKYVMSDAEYDARENTYRKFKQEKLRQDPTWTLEKEIAARRGIPYSSGDNQKEKVSFDDDYQAEEASHIVVGGRCEVVTQEGSKRGVVRYVGTSLKGLPKGYWVGIEYDEPVGKNNGTLKGVVYFECADTYGAFVRPCAVTMGDYPPFDDEITFSDDDEL